MSEEKSLDAYTQNLTPDELRKLQTQLRDAIELQSHPRMQKSPTEVGITLEKKTLTEGAKFDQGKPAFGLLAPEMLFGVSEILEHGATKYAARNWEKGISYTRVFGGLMRHLWAWWGGQKNDPDTGKSHLWHAGCGLMFLIAYEARGMNEFDDRK